MVIAVLPSCVELSRIDKNEACSFAMATMNSNINWDAAIGNEKLETCDNNEGINSRDNTLRV